MILFLEDWKKYPYAKLHLSTTNKSFINHAALYREMGLKNHGFLLALHNPALEHVDPHDTNLTLEQMAAIALECRENPWYFLREVARVPVKGSSEPSKFLAHRGNIALFWLFFNHILTILVQIRQTGKSVSMDVLDIYLLNIASVNVTIALLTKDDGLRSFNLERLKEIQSELPFYLNQKAYDDISNTEMMSIKKMGNEFRAYVPQKSVKAALNVGRGLTVPVMKFDEAAFIANIALSAPAALAAGTAARDTARKLGTHYGTIFTTTAGKKDDRDGRFMFELISNSAQWTEKFMDATNQEELYLFVRANSPKGQLRVNCTFNHRQLGFTDAWLKQAIEDSTGTGEDIERDFFNKWTSGSQSSPITPELADRIRASESEAIFNEISPINGYVTKWYIQEQQVKQDFPKRPAVLSVDSSDAVGSDDISVNLRDAQTGAVLAAGLFNETNLIKFTEWLLNWLLKYDNVTLIIERRSSGPMILDYLCMMLIAHHINPFKRIYNRIVQEAQEFPQAFEEIKKAQAWQLNDLVIKYKKSFGFATSSSGMHSRSELYGEVLSTSVKYTCDQVFDKVLINQLLGLVIKNGRIDHEDGGHDDACISWLMAYWLLTKGRNLNFYGIESQLILSHNTQKLSEKKAENSFDHQKQSKIKDDINSLVEKLKKERDPFLTTKLETQLQFLYSQYDHSLGHIVAYDDLIKELKEVRRSAVRNKPQYATSLRNQNYTSFTF